MPARLLPACQRAFGACRSALCARAHRRPLPSARRRLWVSLSSNAPPPSCKLASVVDRKSKVLHILTYQKKAECSVLTSFLLFCFCTEELVFDFKSKIKEEVSLKHCAWPWFFLAKSYFNKYLFVIYLYFNTIFYVKPVLGMTPLSKNYCLT